MKFLSGRRFINLLLVFSLLGNAALVGYLAKSGGLRRFFLKFDLVEPAKTREAFQRELEERFRKYPNTAAEVVFAGDSLVGDGPWAELLGEIHNRGIGGETTAGLLGRLDEILDAKPLRITLLIGTNDLAASVPEPQVLRNYRAILDRIRRESPKTIVTVLGLLPVNPELKAKPTQTNAEITSVNRKLKELVGEFPGVRYLDLTSFVADQSGTLKRELTTDGIHLNVDGYLAIRKPIQEDSTR